ncbi:hypothetical protein PINS_up017528 [Pythium insidiosum]|nr:hypothetical protein PINS_up017528 [Pythium insidiosum]
MLIVVMLLAIYVYRRLMNLPCIRFLIERNDIATKENELATMGPVQNLLNLVRIFKVIWVPAIAQWLIFFVSPENHELTPKWYCAPGIIGSYNYGDFIGRILCTAAVYKIFTMRISSLPLKVRSIEYVEANPIASADVSLLHSGEGAHGVSLPFCEVSGEKLIQLTEIGSLCRVDHTRAGGGVHGDVRCRVGHFVARTEMMMPAFYFQTVSEAPG